LFSCGFFVIISSACSLIYKLGSLYFILNGKANKEGASEFKILSLSKNFIISAFLSSTDVLGSNAFL